MSCVLDHKVHLLDNIPIVNTCTLWMTWSLVGHDDIRNGSKVTLHYRHNVRLNIECRATFAAFWLLLPELFLEACHGNAIQVGLRGGQSGQFSGTTTCKGRQDFTGIIGNTVPINSGFHAQLRAWKGAKFLACPGPPHFSGWPRCCCDLCIVSVTKF